MNLPFDPDEYVAIRAPVVDSFEYVATDPDTKAEIRVSLNEQFWRKTADVMNAKFERTGDLCPIVVGHTKKGLPEVDQPPAVGYLHDYTVEPFDNKPTLFATHYIRKVNRIVLNRVEQTLTAKELIERFPRRSGEVWFATHEIDPHSLLGATTPHRNLGLLKLSSDGSAGLSYDSPGELNVPDDPKTGKETALEAKLDQLLSMVGQLTETIHAAIQPPETAHDQSGSIDDILKGLEGDEPAEKPKEKKEDKPKDDEEKVKLQKELDDAVIKLNRTVVSTRLSTAGIDPATSEDLIADLIAQPDDVRERFLVRLERTRTGVVSPRTTPLDAAVRDANGGTGNVISTDEQKAKVVKLAREENIPFASAAKKLGFSIVGK